MSFEDLLIDDFYAQSRTETDDGGGGRTFVWADVGASFKGRLSTWSGGGRIDASERLSSDKLIVFATHKLFCLGTVVLTEDQRIRFGTRYFEIKGIVNPSNISHHLEVYLLELVNEV